MNTSPESLSLQLIEEMERLEAAVTASFSETDALLARLGLSRETLSPMLSENRKSLSESDQIKLEKLERDWRHRLEMELNHSGSLPAKRKRTGIRIGLFNRI
ncbi:hypothetical protein [Hahella ganghwensis]|uniref:hypothetical protein n=1 Tax=Hahella ganghwensis TaxID=286420 RepID=UPI000363B7E8|nr:hypothetical protein [Hahella ganghwensis]